MTVSVRRAGADGSAQAGPKHECVVVVVVWVVGRFAFGFSFIDDQKESREEVGENVPGGCIKQHTTNPLAALLAKCNPGPSFIPACLINLLFAKKYVGSCTLLPNPVRTIAAPTPRYKPLTPSCLVIFVNPSTEFLYPCCVPTGRKGE